MPKIVKLIYSTLKRGKGIKESPVRIVEQYHKLNGDFVFEIDPNPKMPVQENGPMQPILPNSSDRPAQ